MKFITKLTLEEKLTLTEAHRNHPSFRIRQRAHALLLNDRGYLISRLSELFEVQHETVSGWLKAWGTDGLLGLYDRPRSGRPTRLTSDDEKQLLDIIDKNHRQTKTAIAQLQEVTGKTASPDTVKRILKSYHYRWKRCRQPLKEKRDEEAFRRRQAIMNFLKQKDDEGQLNLFCYDETGASLTPSIPYGWQPIGQTKRILCQRSKRLNKYSCKSYPEI